LDSEAEISHGVKNGAHGLSCVREDDLLEACTFDVVEASTFDDLHLFEDSGLL
jgi:hypothetical protein